jgi:hypothetical protein
VLIWNRSLESFFDRYLNYLVSQSKSDIKVVYKSGLEPSPTRVYHSPKNKPTTRSETLELRVLSPAFFGRCAHYSHTIEAFDRESIFTDEKNRTIWVSRPDLLARLLSGERDGKDCTSQVQRVEQLRWKVFQQLRCPPAITMYPFPKQGSRTEDIQFIGATPLDHFVQASCRDAWLYRRQCARLFLAQRFAYGLTTIIDLFDLLLRVFFIWSATFCLAGAAPRSRDLGSPKIIFIVSTVSNLMWMNVVHAWAYVKGCA